MVAGLAFVIALVAFAVLEEDLGCVFAQPVGDAGWVLEKGMLDGVGGRVGARSERGDVRLWVEGAVDVVDVVVDVVGGEEARGEGLAAGSCEIANVRGFGVLGGGV